MLHQHFYNKNSNTQKEHGFHNSHPHQQHAIFLMSQISIHKNHIKQDKHANDPNNGKIILAHIGENEKLPLKFFQGFFFK